MCMRIIQQGEIYPFKMEAEAAVAQNTEELWSENLKARMGLECGDATQKMNTSERMTDEAYTVK